ncbi:craniofacial development protein 2-like [Montipora capricornis]|uniref:craniofacial development protein 2-like n=1 Tax=Montipora capricornis TaxID=246305 RepID=UPI0035F18A87
MNENGQRLLELCCHHGLCITNSYVKCNELHKVSWRHLQSHQWHQLDLVITRRADFSSVLHTRSYHSADCDTDQSPVACKLRLKPRKIHHGKIKGRPHIKTCGTLDHIKAQSFADRLEEKLAAQPTTSNPDAKWSHLRDAIYDSAKTALSKKDRKNADWFEACWEEMQPVTEAERKAMLAHKQNPSPSTCDALRSARSKAQLTARRCAN